MMHNFLKKLAIMADQGKIPKTSVSDVDVKHDDWCAFLKDCRKECNRLGSTISATPITVIQMFQ